MLSTGTCPRIDVFTLHQDGALVHRAITRWQWLLPTMNITVTARVDGHHLFLRLNDSAEVAYSILPKAGTTGNTYPFFGCTCERRARYLYIHGGTIACRHCHRLGYPSRMPPRNNNTTARRLARVKAELAMLEAKMLATPQNARLARLKPVPRASDDRQQQRSDQNR